MAVFWSLRYPYVLFLRTGSVFGTVEMWGRKTPTSYSMALPASSKIEKNRIQMRRKFSFETRIVIGATIFALASSALLYCIPPLPTGSNHLRGAFIPYYRFAYLTVVKYPIAKIDGAKLYENGVALHRTSALQDIVSKGNGLYEVYINANETIPTLMFSSSDNTDPNTNGRKYRLE